MVSRRSRDNLTGRLTTKTSYREKNWQWGQNSHFRKKGGGQAGYPWVQAHGHTPPKKICQTINILIGTEVPVLELGF